jgi:hypothetical protein
MTDQKKTLPEKNATMSEEPKLQNETLSQTENQTPPTQQAQDFAAQAEEKPPGLIAEFVDFLLHNKKWWLTPIILVLLILGFIIYIGGSVAAPFIYPLFG